MTGVLDEQLRDILPELLCIAGGRQGAADVSRPATRRVLDAIRALSWAQRKRATAKPRVR